MEPNDDDGAEFYDALLNRDPWRMHGRVSPIVCLKTIHLSFPFREITKSNAVKCEHSAPSPQTLKCMELNQTPRKQWCAFTQNWLSISHHNW